jgi:hypothetical protein
MNKTNKLSYILPVVIIMLVLIFSAFDNSGDIHQVAPIAGKDHVNKSAELVNSKKSTSSFEKVSLFNKSTKANRSALNTFVSDASFLTVDKNSLQQINASKPSEFTLQVPLSSGSMLEVELVKVSLIPEDFKIRILGLAGNTYESFKPGLYYQGIIKGNNSSIATLSIFENNVMGIFSTENGNYVLGSVKDANNKLTNEYILYNDIDALNKPDFHCGVGDAYNKYYKDPIKHSVNGNENSRTTSPVNIDFTCDYQMYLDNGSSVNNVGQYVTGVFLHVRTLYQNEQITVQISNISVFTAADPYRQFATSQTPEILTLFGDNTQNNINGDLAHLLSTRTPLMGGIAWVNVLCQSYEPTSHSGRYAFSQIENNYNPYPVFSWTVTVITHETGHNFGSMHTQACVWPSLPGGGIGAIDSCVDAENGSCFTTTRPNQNGTIMSYCHLNGNINFLRGFGPLPGDTIRGRYNEALCLDSALNSSEMPLDYVLLQNYPNPFNPSTNIKFALPQDGLVTLRIYDMTGREVATLINNSYYAIGIFSYTLDASVYNLASGVYLYKLDVNRDNKRIYSEIKKMVLVK